MKLSGFTLIETLIYSGLVTIIVGTTVLASLSFRSSLDKDSGRIELTSNVQFLDTKLTSLFSGLKNSEVITPSGQSLVLETSKSSGRFRLEQSGGQMILTRDTNNDNQLTAADSARALTTRHVTVSSLLFTRATENGQSVLNVSITLGSGSLSQSISRKVVLQ